MPPPTSQTCSLNHRSQRLQACPNHASSGHQQQQPSAQTSPPSGSGNSGSDSGLNDEDEDNRDEQDVNHHRQKRGPELLRDALEHEASQKKRKRGCTR